ncbi:SpoIIE family protein phosphatase [Amycolatopsis palatopharyngis]|uniref:SpoIIE family protein phosphatase n=1 Tax=Amycolatopsis palatopharyngis TaxID=187982 RepID=UPI000E27F217|nr:SpoIIE family protein phosphatase [Amycolatopsis palatopharyngis]
MTATGPRVFLVGVIPSLESTLRAALAREAELVSVTAEEVLEHVNSSDARGPTVVVLGRELPAPVGLVNALRPDAIKLAVIVVATPATEAKLSTLPLLFTDNHARRLPVTDVGKLPGMVRELLANLARQAAYTDMRAVAQRQLSDGTTIAHQVGDQLFGEFLTQAPVGAVMLDDRGGLAAWNQRAAQLLELTEPGSLGLPLTAYFPPESQEPLRTRLARPEADEHADIFERTRAGGCPQALRLAPQRVSDGAGDERVLVVIEDVTDLLRAQRHLAERTAHAQLSAEVAAAMTAPGPLSQHLRRCAESVANRLDAARVHIWTVHPRGDTLDLVAAAGLDQDDTPAQVRFGETTAGRIATERLPQLNNPASGEANGVTPGDGGLLFAGYPLLFDAELMGVLAVHTHQPFAANTLAVLEGIADQIAVGIRQDRLVHRLRTTADALQRPLLPPHLPDIPGFDLAARYHPFGTGEHIGGDFYDAFTAPDGSHVLVLGDVCGKGAEAAAVTGLVRHTLWAAAQHSADPAYVLPMVNQALRRDGSPFCTLVYALLEPGAGPARVRLACAGHPPPLLIDREATSPLALSGPLLGVFDTVNHPVTKVELRPGDTLVLYTDGFTEGAGSYRQREPEDLAGIAAGIPARSSRPAAQLATALMEDAQRWWGERLRDDLAILTLTAVEPLSSCDDRAS